MDGFQSSRDAREKGYQVIAVGVEHLAAPEGVTYIQHDFLTADVGVKFDYILDVSTIEHVGLGRYGDPPSPDGDLQAMLKLRTLMKPDARHIMTCPIGQDAVIGHYHRVYGHKRLPRLLEGYEVLEQSFRAKDDADEWQEVSKERALAEVPVKLPVVDILHLYYALGLFVLCLK